VALRRQVEASEQDVVEAASHLRHLRLIMPKRERCGNCTLRRSVLEPVIADRQSTVPEKHMHLVERRSGERELAFQVPAPLTIAKQYALP
jgi:hypothetical protein